MVEKCTHNGFMGYDKIAFYVVAHADDWQLFMQPHVYKDLLSTRCKVVFIITAAGDAGFGETFWKAREEGSKSSVRFCLAPAGESSEKIGMKNYHGFPIHYWAFCNSTTCFLRLPDGGLNGKGFPSCQFQCLTKFQSGKVKEITSVDHSAIYKSWHELVALLEIIIVEESEGITERWIHYLHPGEFFNPGDHPDHIATAKALQQMTVLKSLYQVLYTGYSLHSSNEYLEGETLFYKTAMFAVYEKAVYDLSGYSTLKENEALYKNWCSKTARFIEIPAAND